MLRVALIGAGRPVVIGHAPALLALPEYYRVVAIADQSPDVLEDMGILLGVPPKHRHVDYRSLLETEACDLVSISLPHVFHADAVRAALLAGKHVVVERPLAVTVDEAMALVHLAAQHQKQLSVFHYYRYFPPFREAIRLVAEGAIGKPFLIRCEGVTGGSGPGTPSYHPEWHALPDIAGGGVWLDTGYHNAYLCVELHASPVATISAHITNYATPYEVDDTAVALMVHQNGALSTIQTAWSVPSGGRRILEIYGTDGTIALDHDGYPLGMYRNATGSWHHPQINTSHAESFVGLYRELHEALELGAPNPVAPQSALHALHIIRAGYQASETQSVVQVPFVEIRNDGHMQQAA